MDKKFKKIIAIVSLLVLAFTLCSCGSKSDSESYSTGLYAKEMANSYDSAYDYKLTESAESTGYSAYGSSDSGSALTVLNNTNAKLIYTADIYIQTLNLDEEYEKLVSLVKEYDGYFESSSTENVGYYSDSTYRYGYYTVRVPKESYSDFISSVKDNSYITSISEQVEDVGEQYFDLENRLETLRTKEARLQELLKEAKNVSEIIEIESSLSDVEYQINSYQTDLNHYDSLIDYSTISFEIQQVVRVAGGVDQGEGFFSRIGRSLASGWHNFVDGLADFANWIVYNLFTLIIIVAIIFVLAKFHLIKKFLDLFRKKDKKDQIEK